MARKLSYFFTPTHSLPENVPFKRIGIIPYFRNHTDDQIYFFLMLDSKFHELTDCGGLPKSKEKWIDTAIRETDEESRGKFKFLPEEVLNRGIVGWKEDHRIAIIFMDVTYLIPSKMHASHTCHLYRSDYLRGIYLKDKRHRLENSDMFFYNSSELLWLSRQDKKVYYPVKIMLLKLIKGRHIDEL